MDTVGHPVLLGTPSSRAPRMLSCTSCLIGCSSTPPPPEQAGGLVPPLCSLYTQPSVSSSVATATPHCAPHFPVLSASRGPSVALCLLTPTQDGPAAVVLASHPSGNKLCAWLRFLPSQGPSWDLESRKMRWLTERGPGCSLPLQLVPHWLWDQLLRTACFGPLSCWWEWGREPPAFWSSKVRGRRWRSCCPPRSPAGHSAQTGRPPEPTLPSDS